jgi:MFS family permease
VLLLFLLLCVFLFSGVVFGFAPLMLLLAREGVYSELCGSLETPCAAQEARLNLCFVLATVALNLASFPLGIFLDRFGQRSSLAASAVLSVGGSLGLAFSDSVRLDLFIPSLVAVAVGGILNLLAAYSSSFLLPEFQPAVITTFSCTFDLSTVVYAVLNQLNSDLGISRRSLFLGYAGLVAAAVVPPLYLWGGLEKAMHSNPPQPANSGVPTVDTAAAGDAAVALTCDAAIVIAAAVGGHGKEDEKETVEDEKEDEKNDEKEGLTTSGTHVPLEQRRFWVQVRSIEYAFVVSYAIVEMFRANLFIGSVVELLHSYGDGATGHLYSRVFGYILPAGIICVPAIGWSIAHLGLGGSLLLTSMMGAAFSALALVPQLSVQVGTFVVFTAFRAILYSVMNTFCATRFGLDTVGRIIGSVFTVSSLFGLTQYPLLNLTRTHFDGNFTPLFSFMIALTAPVGLMTLAVMHHWNRAAREVGGNTKPKVAITDRGFSEPLLAESEGANSS